MKVNNTLTFNGHFESVQDFSNSFMRVKMKVFAFGENRNGSAFSKVTDRAQRSLKMIPIVAKYNNDYDAYGNKGDLEGHNVTLRKNDNDEYEMYMDTYPFGTTGYDTIYSLEEVNEGTDLNPNIKTYVVIDNVYLWKRYDATRKIAEWMSKGIVPKISMEIDNVSGQFDSNGYFQIEDFEFQAITALGSEVEPCFPRAEIEMYSKKSFKEEFKAMVYELKETLQFDQKGGTEMEDKLIKSDENGITINGELAVTNFEENESVENNAPVEAEDVLEKDEQLIKEDSNEAPVSSDDSTEQSEDVQTKDIIIDENSEDALEKRETVAINENATDLRDEDSAEESVDEDEEKEDFKSKYDDLFTKFEDIQNELNELKSYKRQREEDDIKGKFADKLSEQEFEQVFSSMKDADIQDVEDKLFALYGKKNFSITSANTQVNKVKLALPKDHDIEFNPYGDIFDK